VPEVLIATGANRSAKLWPTPFWYRVVEWCASQGLTIGLLGAAPAQQARYYHSATVEESLLEDYLAKLIAVAATLVVMGPLILTGLVDYTRQSIRGISGIIK
jgi:hypothetical protein